MLKLAGGVSVSVCDCECARVYLCECMSVAMAESVLFRCVYISEKMCVEHVV